MVGFFFCEASLTNQTFQSNSNLAKRLDRVKDVHLSCPSQRISTDNTRAPKADKTIDQRKPRYKVQAERNQTRCFSSVPPFESEMRDRLLNHA